MRILLMATVFLAVIPRGTAEGIDSGYVNFTPAEWTSRYPTSQFAHLLYQSATASEMTNQVNLAMVRRAGFIYVTDDGANNPWDTLPSYWNAEVDYVASLNRAAAQRAQTELSLERERDSKLTLTGRGPVGRYVLEAAAPLGDWKTVSTNLTATGTSVWSILELPPNRFFRTRQE